MRHCIIFYIFFLTICFRPSSCMAINALDWESPALFMTSIDTDNPKSSQILAAKLLLCNRDDKVSELCAEYGKIDTYYNDDENGLIINIPNNWHGFDKFYTKYIPSDRVKKNKYIFMFIFADNELRLIDVMGRYGAKYFRIETDENFSKHIIYDIDSKSDVEFGSPLYNFMPSRLSDRRVSLIFSSKDKLFVDSLSVIVSIPNAKLSSSKGAIKKRK